MRTTVNRSISFNPELFEKMEAYCADRFISRSEYIQRLVINHLGAKAGHNPELVMDSVPHGLISDDAKRKKHRVKPVKGRKKEPQSNPR